MKSSSCGSFGPIANGEGKRDLYLDPGEKDNDGSHVVELDLQVGQRLKAGVSGVVLQQAFEKTTNHRRSGYVHDDRNNTQLGNEQREQNRDR